MDEMRGARLSSGSLPSPFQVLALLESKSAILPICERSRETCYCTSERGVKEATKQIAI
jgi:hypothetical protein